MTLYVFTALTSRVVPTVGDLAPNIFHHCMFLFWTCTMTRPSILLQIAIIYVSFFAQAPVTLSKRQVAIHVINIVENKK